MSRTDLSSELQLADFQAFACTHCGLCCTRPWRVVVEPAVEEGIRSSQLYERREREGYVPLAVHEDGKLAANRQLNKECMFHQDQLCGIHGELGGAAKPMGCQLFPYHRGVRTPSGIFFTMSFACPPVVAGLDTDVQSSRADLASVILGFPDAITDLPDAERPVALTMNRTISWNSYVELENQLLRGFDASRPLESLLMLTLDVIAVEGTRDVGDIEGWPNLGCTFWDLGFSKDLLKIYLSYIVAIVESDDDRAPRDKVAESLGEGQRVASPRFEHALPVLDIDSPPSAELKQIFHRYVFNTMVGKSLLQPTVVSRLAALAIACPLLVFYAEVYAQELGLSACDSECLRRAFETIDADVVSHSTALERFFLQAESTLKESLGL